MLAFQGHDPCIIGLDITAVIGLHRGVWRYGGVLECSGACCRPWWSSRRTWG